MAKISKTYLIGGGITAAAAASLLLYFIGVGISDEIKLSYQNTESRGVHQGQCSQMRWSLDTHAYTAEDMKIYRSVYGEICADEPKPRD